MIDAKLAAMPGVERVVLLGYSSGSLLARRVFCMAHGADPTGRITRPAVWWARRVDRLVVLAGITRGWAFSTASPDHVRFLSPVLLSIARIVGWWKSLSPASKPKLPFIWQLKRGSPFVVSTRIQYVNVMASMRREQLHSQSGKAQSPLRAGGLPSTVFLLGSRDEYISPADCTELGPQAEFAYVELGGSNHSEALQVSGTNPISAQRRERIVAALAQGFDALRSQPWVLPAGDIDDYLDPMDLSEGGLQAIYGDRVDHAVMVVHGIRDNGFWTKRVAREIKTQARKSAIVVRAPSPSYGFFSMWDFVKPNGRRNATYWFMERYADVRSHFPNAKISFVGHSNGTYIAARAMELCPAVTFERLVFAGSVVRRDYKWSGRVGQVKEVLNYVGNADGVVAFLPAVFEFLGLRWLDVGGAGAFGFREAEPMPALRKFVPIDAAHPVELTEVRYVSGGHGAAISEAFWPEIASFVLHGHVPERASVPRVVRVAALFRWAPVFTLVGLGIAGCLLALPLLVVAGVALTARDPVALANPLLWSIGSGAAIAFSMGVSWLWGRFLKAW
jgi:pimeloyl-ACP methyl ester carboxylesterase